MIMRPATKSTRKVKNKAVASAVIASAIISYFAAYLRYFGVLFFGKGYLVARVPSKASVSSAIMKMRKPEPISA